MSDTSNSEITLPPEALIEDWVFGLNPKMSVSEHTLTFKNEEKRKKLKNCYVKIKVKNKNYLYGELHANLSFNVADSTLNILKPSVITTNRGYSDDAMSSRRYMLHLGDEQHPDVNKQDWRQTIIANHVLHQVNPHSDILNDYELASVSPIFADLTDLRKTFNFDDREIDEVNKDRLTPAIVNKYMGPEVKHWLRLRGYDKRRDGKKSLKTKYYRVNALIPLVRDSDNNRLNIAMFNSAFNSIVNGSPVNTVFAPFIVTKSNKHSNLNLMRNEDLYSAYLYGDTVTFGGNHRYYYGFFNSIYPHEYKVKMRSYANGGTVEYMANIAEEPSNISGSIHPGDIPNPGEFVYKPTKHDKPIAKGFRPGTYFEYAYVYLIEHSPGVNLPYFTKSPQVKTTADEAAPEGEEDENKVSVTEDEKEELHKPVYYKWMNDTYFYDSKRLSIQDYLNAARYGEVTDKGTLKAYYFDHTSPEAILANMGRYVIKTEEYDATTTLPDDTIEFLETKFHHFLDSIHYFQVSKFYDTRHLFSGVQTYTEPEKTFAKWKLKSNALVWFDLPKYIDLFRRAFPNVKTMDDFKALPTLYASNQRNFNAFMYYVVTAKEDKSLTQQNYHPTVSPVALQYTRRPVPSFNYMVTLGMNMNQAERLNKDPEDMKKNPQKYATLWDTYEISDSGESVPGFQGMITPLISKVWKQDKSVSETYQLVKNVIKTEQGEVINTAGWPNIDDNYEFDKFRTTLDYFGHEKVIMVNKHDYPKLVTEEDMLFITNLNDSKRIMTIGANSRTNYLNYVLRYSEQNKENVNEQYVNEVHLAKAFLKEKGHLKTEFKLVPSANHPLYYGEGTVVYETPPVEIPEEPIPDQPPPLIPPPNIIRGYSDEIWLNTTMGDFRRLMAEGRWRHEYQNNIEAPFFRMNPDWVLPGGYEKDQYERAAGNKFGRIGGGWLMRYRSLSDHALPWLMPGLFIAEDVNYEAMIKHINKLNEEYDNMYSYDFLKFANPGYQTGGTPFITLNFEDLFRLVGYSVYDVTPHTNYSNYMRGQTVRMHLDNLVGKWDAKRLHGILEQRKTGQPNVIGNLRPVENPYPHKWAKFVMDDAGQVFQVYDDGTLVPAFGSRAGLEDNRQNPSSRRFPFTANLAEFNKQTRWIPLFGNRMDGWDSRQYGSDVNKTLTDEQAYERLQRAKAMKNPYVNVITEEIGAALGTQWSGRPRNPDGYFKVFPHTKEGNHLLADYAINIPTGDYAFERDDGNKKHGDLMTSPGLLGLHNFDSLRDYRFTVSIPTSSSAPSIYKREQRVVTYKLTDSFIDSLFSGKRVNPAFEIVDQSKNTVYFNETTESNFYDKDKRERIVSIVRSSTVPLVKGHAETPIGTTRMNGIMIAEDVKKATGEYWRGLRTRRFQIIPSYTALLHHTTGKDEYKDYWKDWTAIEGYLPFQAVNKVYYRFRGHGGHTRYGAPLNTKTTRTQALPPRGFYAELTYNHLDINPGPYTDNHYPNGEHIKTIEDVTNKAYKTSYPLHGMMDKFTRLIEVKEKESEGSGS